MQMVPKAFDQLLDQAESIFQPWDTIATQQGFRQPGRHFQVFRAGLQYLRCEIANQRPRLADLGIEGRVKTPLPG